MADLSTYFGNSGILWGAKNWIDSSQWFHYWINHHSSEASRAHTYAKGTRENIVKVKTTGFHLWKGH